MKLDGRQRLWAAATIGVLGLGASLGYLEWRLRSVSAEYVDEETPPQQMASDVPMETHAYPLQTQPVAQSPKPNLQGYTNEELQSFLEEDKKRLGIKRIYTKDELRAQAQKPPDLTPAQTRQREEAIERIREMAAELRKANEMRKRQPVVLEGDRPSLLSKPEDSYLAQGAPTAPDPALPQASPSFVPPRAGPASDEERVLKSQAELDRLWDDMKSSRPKPKIDFDKFIVVAVIADRDSGKGVMIPRVQRARGRVTVEYRDAYNDEAGSYYELAVIDKTDAPIVFRKVTSLTTESPK